MIDDRLDLAVGSWLRSTDPLPPDSFDSVRRVMTHLRGTMPEDVRRRWGRASRPARPVRTDAPRPPMARQGRRRDSANVAAIVTFSLAAVLLVVVGGAALMAPRDGDHLRAVMAAPSPSEPAAEPSAVPTDVPADVPTHPASEVSEAESMPATAAFGETQVLTPLEAGADPVSLTKGTRGTALLVDRASGTVLEVDRDGYIRVIARAGDSTDGPDDTTDVLATPSAVTRAGINVFIVDADGALWIWRQSRESSTSGYLQKRWTYEEGFPSTSAAVAPGTEVLAGAWRAARDFDLYSVDPSSTLMIHRGNPDDSLRPPKRLVAGEEMGDTIVDLYVDDRILALGEDGLTVFEVRSGGSARRDRAFALETPPGRPTDYRFIDSLTSERDGPLYLYDAVGGRIDAFDKRGGDHLGSWAPGEGQPPMIDVRGMFVEDVGDGRTVVTWATPEGLYRSTLWDGPLPTPELAEALIARTTSSESRRMDFHENGVRLEADGFRINVAGQVFDGTRRMAVSGHVGPREGELELFWYERGIQSRLRFDVVVDDSHWWVEEIQHYDGVKGDGNYVYYSGLAPLTRRPIGEALEGDLDLHNTGADRARFREPGSARLRIDGMRLTAFEPGTRPAPLTGCDRVPEDANDRGYASGYLTGEGEPLEGVEGMTPAEIEAILQGLGLCYVFYLTHPYPDQGEDPQFDTLRGDAWERWCIAPPDGRIVGIGRRGPGGIGVDLSPEPYSDEPGSIVRVSVTSDRSDWPEPPPAGTGCPTR